MPSSGLSSPPSSVTIIGAGLGGLTLALALKKNSIPVKLYELRTPDYDFGGAIMLSPNALRVLDSLDVYSRIRAKGFNFETLTFVTDHDYKKIGTYYFGQEEMYGYKALRIYRSTLIAELREVVEERGISIEYGRKYSHIVSETEDGVTFAFADGTEERADLLVGADGIHSKVRQFILPSIVPSYSGFLGVTYAFPLSKLRFPPDHPDMPLPVSIHGPHGAFVLAPQNPAGTEIFAGRQFAHPAQARAGWDALLTEPAELVAMHQRDAAQWSDFVQSGQEQAGGPDAHGLAIWPFHTVPRLDAWASPLGRVVIVGDAAHAIPPTAGQGANQAFEDGASLACLLKALSPRVGLRRGLGAWQRYRQARIDRVLRLSDQMNNMRLPEEEKRKLAKELVWQDESADVGEGGQLSWLYSTDVEKDMADEIEKLGN